MSSKRVARFNTLVVDHLLSRLDRAHQENFSECRLFDTDGSKYLLQREQKNPNKIRLSFSLAAFTDNIAVASNLIPIAADLSARYQGDCQISSDSGGSYQLVVTIQLDTLHSLHPTQQLQYLQGIACIRADVLCWPLRLLLYTKAQSCICPANNTMPLSEKAANLRHVTAQSTATYVLPLGGPVNCLSTSSSQFHTCHHVLYCAFQLHTLTLP